MNMAMPPRDTDIFANIESCDYNNLVGFDDINDIMADDLSLPETPLLERSISGSGRNSASPPSVNSNPTSLDDTKSFPYIFHTIVSDPNTDDVIHWLPCGTRFVICKKDEFAKNIIPQYFGGRSGGAKFTSFTRRLKRWNFSRVPAGREMGAYYHKEFLRDDPELAMKIIYPPIAAKSAEGGGKVGASGGMGGSSGGSKKKSPTLSSKKPYSKARRRASTGCMPVNFDILDITPVPIRGPVNAFNEDEILPLPNLEKRNVHDELNDMKNWLSDADFINMEEPLTNPLVVGSSSEALAGGAEILRTDSPLTIPGTTTVDAEPEPASVVSNSSSQYQGQGQQNVMLPPPFFPNKVIPAGGFPNQAQADSYGGIMEPSLIQQMLKMTPRTMMRRHSIQMTRDPMPMPLFHPGTVAQNDSGRFNSSGMNSSFNLSSQLKGTNFGSTQAGMSSASNMMGFASNNNVGMFPNTDNLHHQNSLLGQHGSRSGIGGNVNDLKRELSIEESTSLDPFT